MVIIMIIIRFSMIKYDDNHDDDDDDDDTSPGHRE